MLYRGKISQKLRHKQIISELKSTAIINLGKAIILFLCGADTRHKSMQRLIRVTGIHYKVTESHCETGMK